MNAATLHRSRAWRFGPLSLRVAPATVLVGLGLAAVAVLAAVVSMLTGSVALSFGEVVDALQGEGTRDAQLIVNDVRVPRAVTAIVAGAAFGVAGALTQTLFRNDLASPDVIGVQTGAALGAVVVFTTAGTSSGNLAVAALGGGLGFALIVWLLSASGRRLRVEHVLIGVAVAAVGEAGIAYLLRRAEIDDLQRAAVWLAGDLTGVTSDQAWQLAIVSGVLLLPVLALAPAWRQLQLGDDLAVTLGARVSLVRAATALLAVGLTASATAITGPIAFVALVAPHIGRRLARQASPSLWLAGTAGAALVSVADVVARRLLSLDVPVGVITVAVGAPVLLWLIIRGSRS